MRGDLIRGVRWRSDGHGRRGAWGAALLAGAELRGGAPPEYAVSGVPGAIWDGVRPWSSIAAWVIHGCAQIRGFGARDMGAAAQAASLAACAARRVHGVAYRL